MVAIAQFHEYHLRLGKEKHFEESCATISARDETSSLRNIRFKACLTEFSVIQRAAPI